MKSLVARAPSMRNLMAMDSSMEAAGSASFGCPTSQKRTMKLLFSRESLGLKPYSVESSCMYAIASARSL